MTKQDKTPKTSHEASEQTVENAEKLDQPWTPEPQADVNEDTRTQAEKNDRPNG